ncbi:hypothetical protein [Thioalkalivibrio thiocyanodenitrificans]|uniref:hypothetical protein n=1 Tax=Thioalkalivibrio thiocyanodenitrificans TaxID=243063 RepID=UPI0003613449|nr:hypothetical protein [Thioalkalivibrio thiocyanodenitrificans]
MGEKVNENCLAGMACPKCGDLGPFKIAATQAGIAVVHDDGIFQGVDGDIEWEGGARCECMACGKVATVAEFSGEAEPLDEAGQSEGRAGEADDHRVMCDCLDMLAIATTAIRDQYMGFPDAEIVANTGMGMKTLLRDLVQFLRENGVDDEGGWDCDATEDIKVKPRASR